jgi:hypothetical protein
MLRATYECFIAADAKSKAGQDRRYERAIKAGK